MKKFALGDQQIIADSGMTDEEKDAWLHTQPGTYHSLHIERMGSDLFHWRDSREGFFYIGSHFELAQYLWSKLTCRTATPKEERRSVVPIRQLTDEEVEDLFKDL